MVLFGSIAWLCHRDTLSGLTLLCFFFFKCILLAQAQSNNIINMILVWNNAESIESWINVPEWKALSLCPGAPSVCVCVCVRRLSAMLHISHYFELPQTCHSISQFDVCVRSEFYTQWRRSVFLLCSPHQPHHFCAVKTQEQLLIKKKKW